MTTSPEEITQRRPMVAPLAQIKQFLTEPFKRLPEAFDDLKAPAMAWRGGEIYPFEYDAVRAIQDATTVEQIEKIIADTEKNPHYRWPFEPGSWVVNMLDERPGLKKGVAYPVINCYDGHSGCGAQTWVRVKDALGVIVGYDPDRFIQATTLAEIDRNFEVRQSLMAAHTEVLALLKNLGDGELLKPAREKANRIRRNIESAIGAAAPRAVIVEPV